MQVAPACVLKGEERWEGAREEGGGREEAEGQRDERDGGEGQRSPQASLGRLWLEVFGSEGAPPG